MRLIRVHGHGGQGVRLACRILAAAFTRAGWRAWAIGGGGDDPPGIRLTALVQVDDRAATLDDVILLDPGLLDDATVGAARPGGVVLVAAAAAPCVRAAGPRDIVAVDAAAIAAACGLTPDVGAAMAGAFGGITGLLPLDTLEAAVTEAGAARAGAHLAACRAGYRAAAPPRSYHMAS